MAATSSTAPVRRGRRGGIIHAPPATVSTDTNTPTNGNGNGASSSSSVDDRKRSSRRGGREPAAGPPHANAASCRVHRCRFLDWQPSGVRALAFNSTATRLAVARHNGDIEIWHAHTAHGWFCDRVIPGSGEASVQSLMWVPVPGATHDNERLFSAGLNARLIEWNLLKLAPKYASDSYGGAVWCATLSPSRKQIILGCEDGSLRLFDITDNFSAPVYLKALNRHDGRVLSVAWNGTLLVSGGSDGLIRMWDVATSRNTERITVERLGGQPTLIWALQLLSDGTIVSGDSLGHVQFWNSRFATLIQTFSHHKADVLCLASSDQAVYASGVDNTVTEFRVVRKAQKSDDDDEDSSSDRGSSPTSPDDGKWVLVGSQRVHTHDVHALALAPPTKVTARKNPGAAPSIKNLKVVSSEESEERLLVSGGVDTQLCVYHTSISSSRSFRLLRPRKIAPFPHRSPISITSPATSATPTRFLFHHAQRLELWQLGSLEADIDTSASREGDKLTLAEPYSHLLTLHTSAARPVIAADGSSASSGGGLNLICSAISADCRWMACSDPLSVKLYRLTATKSASSGTYLMDVKREDVSRLVLPSSSLVFSHDCTKLICGTLDSIVQVLDLNKMKLVASFEEHAGDTTSGVSSYDSDDSDSDSDAKEQKVKKVVKKAPKSTAEGAAGLIKTLAVSADGQWFASGDDHNRIHLYNLDTLAYHASLPVLDSPPLTFAFHPTTSTLVVACASNHFYVFDVDDKKLSDWSREHGAALPRSLVSRHEKIVRIAFDASRPSTLLLQSHSFLCHVDLARPVPNDGKTNAVLSTRKRRGSRTNSNDFSKFAKTASAAGEQQRTAAESSSASAAATSESSSSSSSSSSSERAADPWPNFRIIEHFRPLLFADFISPSDKTMLVVETPWLKIMQSFPAPLYRHRYGT